MEYKIIIDQKVVDEYNSYYFKLHPRARKPPIDRPLHPTMNSWMILPRVQMNALKQKWKDFICYLINRLGYKDLKISKCEMEFTSYMKTRRIVDVDAFCPKFILDGFTASGFIIDDNHTVLQALTLKVGYDKENPRTEITINTIEE